MSQISFTEAEYVRREYEAFSKELLSRLKDLQAFISSHHASPFEFPPRFNEKFYQEICEAMIGKPDEGMNPDTPFVRWALEKFVHEHLDKPQIKKRRWLRIN